MNNSHKKPRNPNFSSGPTRKPHGWSVNKLNLEFLGRYHRSTDVRDHIERIILKLKKTLGIPKGYKIFFLPGSSTGAMTSIMSSILGKNKITSIIYDYWGLLWTEELIKLKLRVDSRKDLSGKLPLLDKIPINNDVVFVWNATSNGMSISNINFLKKNHKGLIISDLTSAVFVCNLPWNTLDISVFSLQKALGAESQKGVAVLSPRALERIKSNQLKLFSLKSFDFLINTPSLMAFADLDLCLDLYNMRGGIHENIKICQKNKEVLDKWEANSTFIKYFSAENQSITPSFFVYKKRRNHKKILEFLRRNKIAFDVNNFRTMQDGFRIWNGPNIKKNDLIALTNWLDWCFNKFVK